MSLIDSMPFDPPLSASERERVTKLMRKHAIPELYAVAVALGVYKGVADLPKNLSVAHLRALASALLEQRREVKEIEARKLSRDALHRPPPKESCGGRIPAPKWV